MKRGDAQALATSWEHIVELLDYPTSRVCVCTCMSLAGAYSRALGVRLGSRPTEEKIQRVATVAVAMVMAVREKPRLYPSLASMGVGDDDVWGDMVTRWKERELNASELEDLPFMDFEP